LHQQLVALISGQRHRPPNARRNCRVCQHRSSPLDRSSGTMCSNTTPSHPLLVEFCLLLLFVPSLSWYIHKSSFFIHPFFTTKILLKNHKERWPGGGGCPHHHTPRQRRLETPQSNHAIRSHGTDRSAAALAALVQSSLGSLA
jgi:hypothetical protein